MKKFPSTYPNNTCKQSLCQNIRFGFIVIPYYIGKRVKCIHLYYGAREQSDLPTVALCKYRKSTRTCSVVDSQKPEVEKRLHRKSYKCRSANT